MEGSKAAALLFGALLLAAWAPSLAAPAAQVRGSVRRGWQGARMLGGRSLPPPTAAARSLLFLQAPSQAGILISYCTS